MTAFLQWLPLVLFVLLLAGALALAYFDKHMNRLDGSE